MLLAITLCEGCEILQQSQTKCYINKRSNEREIQLLDLFLYLKPDLNNNCNDPITRNRLSITVLQKTCSSMPVSLAKINFRLVSIPFLYISYGKNSLTINYENPKMNITHDEDITILSNHACTIFLLHKTGLMLFVLHKTSLTGSVLLSSVLIIFKIVSHF